MAEPFEEHVPVLGDAVVEHLAAASPLQTASKSCVLVDCTLGLGGHAGLMLRQNPALRLIGLDLDETNLEIARTRLAGFADRVRLVQANFADLRAVLDECGVPQAEGILADLGLSSNQLLDPQRGFTFDADGPLDMRMDRGQRTTAADLVNTMSEGELSDLLYLQSQERHSRRIAKRICQARRQGRLNSTQMLARLVAAATGEGSTSHRSRIHPATRTFMALRISVNSEIDALRRLLSQAPACLAPGGRIGVISFHSVEDRVVKLDFRDRCRDGLYRLVTKKPVIADEEERTRNPRSRSAKLRVAERTSAP
ncbi:MAG TPA: 16S rRNA (cytosine(1402)-N(4))-methyltransferase RsmH [Phycisphaerae bacterium]|nr:16S rRNA (cytosine(1402)-N(4))-methyltransferase RsmH [Phycisphaerae bacterium]